jgi:hypothetical protein
MMHQYRLWVRVAVGQSTYTTISAQNDTAAKLLGESMFGQGMVLGYTRIS